MSAAGGILGLGRAMARGLMESTVRIRRAGDLVRNPETGTLEPSWETVYEGPARLRFADAQPRDVDQAGQRFAEQEPTVWLPIDGTAGIRKDDVGEVLTNPFDPGVVGLTFRVTGGHAQTHSTSRRLPVEVLSFA